MANYVDGFVIPIKKDKVSAYEDIASAAGVIWMKHGALAYFECLGEDLEPDMQEVQADDFVSRFNLKEDETVLFSFIIYKSREHRDEVNAKVMADPGMAEENWPKEMPFEVSRMLFGGFQSLIALGSIHNSST